MNPKSVVAALGLWTAFGVALLVLAPGMSRSLDCMSLVGHTPECEEQQLAINVVTLALWTWPILLVIGLGYAAIAVMIVIGRRRRRSPDTGEVNRCSNP